MISIIKIITELHKPFRLTKLTHKKRIEALTSAEKRIVMVCPIISKEEAVLLVQKKECGGVKLYFDCNQDNLSDSTSYIEAVKLLIAANIIPTKTKWDIGFIIVDNSGWIYYPGEELEVDYINAIELDLGEIETFHKSIFIEKEVETERSALETNQEFESKKAIVKEAISKAQEQINGKSLFQVLNEKIQFVEIEVKGLRNIQNKTVSLKSDKFEFIDKAFNRRFKAGYMIFDHVEQDAFSKKIAKNVQQIQDEVDKMKKKFMTNTCEGAVIKTNDIATFVECLEKLRKEKVSKLKEDYVNDFNYRLDLSKSSLKKFIEKLISKKAIRLKFQTPTLFELSPEDLKKRNVELIFNEIKFPTAEELLEDIDIDHTFKGLTKQVCSKESFQKDISKKYGLNLKEMLAMAER